MNQNLKALLRLILVGATGSSLLVINHMNKTLAHKNQLAQTQITQLNHNVRTIKQHHHEIIKQLPNTYNIIRQQGSQIVNLQNKLVRTDPIVQPTKYHALTHQLSQFIGNNPGWDAAVPWMPNDKCHIELVFGGTTSDEMAYKVGFQISDQHHNIIGFIQAIYSNNKFNDFTSYYTEAGGDAFNEATRKYRKFSDFAAQEGKYKDVIKSQKHQETHPKGASK